jgi:adenosine deaminase
VTVNSDDPSYFGGYVNDNYKQVAKAVGLDASEVIQLAKNSFAASFIPDAEKQKGLDAIESCVESAKE